MNIQINDEQKTDIQALEEVIKAAFLNAEHTSHTEHLIVKSLRKSCQLTVSILAVENEKIVGHIAISPVMISSGETEWYGLGPISVLPEKQGLGIGSLLMQTALARLKQLGAQGCVVLGNPDYYSRFGFQAYPKLYLEGVPPEYFQALSFHRHIPQGQVVYHAAFNIKNE